MKLTTFIFTVLLLVSAACGLPEAQGTVEIQFYSSSTKEDWITAVTGSFNAAPTKTASGKPIVVEVTHANSGGTQRDILDGKIQPTAWSPGDQSWVDGANQVWVERTGQPLVSGDCQKTVYEPIGFAMWRPMAEAMGWPDAPIGWEEIITLASDPQGWARYGHPEWGQFKFGHTLPHYSNSGLLILTTLAYGALGLSESLTPEQVRSEPVVEAMLELELHTSQYEVMSALLIQRMVLGGLSNLHAINTNEAEVLKSNARYGNVLPFQLAFIFPAGGTIWAEHPFCVLDADWVTDEQREAARLYAAYLLEPEQQALVVDNGLRPTDPAVPLHSPIALENGTDPRVTPAIVPPLPSPSGEVAQAIKDVFHWTKRKATVIFALDISSGMSGDKYRQAIEAVKSWLNTLQPGDEAVVYAFNSAPVGLQPSGQVSGLAEPLGQTLDGLQPGGEAALYDALCLAAQHGVALRAAYEAAGDRRLYGVVLLTGGPDKASQNTEADLFDCLSPGEGVTGMRVFTIAYSDDTAHLALLQRIAEHTAGEAFAAAPDTVEAAYRSLYVEP